MWPHQNEGHSDVASSKRGPLAGPHLKKLDRISCEFSSLTRVKVILEASCKSSVTFP